MSTALSMRASCARPIRHKALGQTLKGPMHEIYSFGDLLVFTATKPTYIVSPPIVA
jgi:hypothetical protein